MEVDDPGELGPILVPVKRFILEDRKRVTADVRLRGSQESCNDLENLRIALCSVAESWGVDEGYLFPIEIESIREFDLGCARP